MKLAKVLLSPAAALVGALVKKPKAPAPTYSQPTATPRGNALASAILSRRGSADNRRTGSSGAESAAGGKKTLLGG